MTEQFRAEPPLNLTGLPSGFTAAVIEQGLHIQLAGGSYSVGAAKKLRDWLVSVISTYPTPVHGWTCFHCGETFPGDLAGSRKAREHFGPTPDRDPSCTISARKLRLLEDQLARYRSEDTDLHREIARLRSDHAAALRAEEEKGYARGLRDVGYKDDGGGEHGT